MGRSGGTSRPVEHVLTQQIRARVASDERDVFDTRDGVESASHWQPQALRRLPIRLADLRDHGRCFGLEVLGIGAVDPVPREVADHQRRDACPGSGRAGEWRCIRNHQPDALFSQQRRFVRDSIAECRVEGVRAAGGFSLVEMQAVDLDDPGVTFALDPSIGHSHCPFEQPARSGGPHKDRDRRTFRGQGHS